ncbi:SAF domain-containing protein [Cyanobium sp. Cruz CV13-4-11]|jgi:sialic acid synthase SpsE|uniref:SAF domain-containing protein n=2 Tax=unclassified Cyanobium TaxID=2627006 RepID=UPI0020CFCB7B|nr:SAF domain-containing protein [Cyanobium sp. Cruz CV13-4-11]
MDWNSALQARSKRSSLRDQLAGKAQGLGSLDQPLIGAGHREALALGDGQMQGITTYAAAEIAAGVLFTEANIRIVRPGDGAPPHLFEQLLGRQARQDYSCGTPLSLDQLL